MSKASATSDAPDGVAPSVHGGPTQEVAVGADREPGVDRPGDARAVDPVDDLVAWITAHGERLVMKRSWDYGGKSVHIGRDVVAREGAAGWRSATSPA